MRSYNELEDDIQRFVAHWNEKHKALDGSRENQVYVNSQ
jgi:hypothetical protein